MWAPPGEPGVVPKTQRFLSLTPSRFYYPAVTIIILPSVLNLTPTGAGCTHPQSSGMAGGMSGDERNDLHCQGSRGFCGLKSAK